eukprot:368155-Prymnesium_polylepis.1
MARWRWPFLTYGLGSAQQRVVGVLRRVGKASLGAELRVLQLTPLRHRRLPRLVLAREVRGVGGVEPLEQAGSRSSRSQTAARCGSTGVRPWT